MGKSILGVDEAGRGAVVGPLSIAAVVIDEDGSGKLKRIGVKDSKKLTRRKREGLAEKIREIAEDFAVLKISAESIDEEMSRKSLNRIEAERMAELINTLKPELAIVDATEVKTGKVERELRALLDEDIKNQIELKAENYADDNYPVVSAASILAKVLRDDSVSGLEEEMGEEIGNGYPSDGRTVEFLEEVFDDGGEFPDCVRECWTTVEKIKEEKGQNDLSKFCD